MEICYANLVGFRLTKGGNFTKDGKSYYVERESCIICGHPYLTYKYKQSKYCSKNCAFSGNRNSFYGKKHSNESKIKISKAKIGRNTGRTNASWKGGLWKANLPLYGTYKDQLTLVEDVTFYVNDLDVKVLQVKCHKCSKIFTPSLYSVKARIGALNGRITGESNLYCSNRCKNNCSTYGRRYIDYLNINNGGLEIKYTRYELSVWSKEVLLRAGYKCEYCGETATLSHHEQPKKLEPFYALDPDNGIACCVDCHYKYGHSLKCSTFNISQIKCGDES